MKDKRRKGKEEKSEVKKRKAGDEVGDWIRSRAFQLSTLRSCVDSACAFTVLEFAAHQLNKD